MLQSFWRYLYRRQLVRMNTPTHKQWAGENIIFYSGEKLPADVESWPKPPHDYLLECATMGNVYRHQDSGTHALGQAVIKKIVDDGGSKDPKQWQTKHVAGAIMM